MSLGATFRKNGKPLRIHTLQVTPVECVSSIFSENPPKKTWTQALAAFPFGTLRQSVYPTIAAVSGFVLLASLGFAAVINKEPPELKYSLYAAKPLTVGESVHKIYSEDSKSQILNEVFRQYNCPLEGMGGVFVEEAERNGIPWWLVAAVSFQESGCGKKTPKLDGEESYNAWGWAIYGNNVHTFENWARGIETVSKYFGTKFFAKGITNTCDIMKVYTPPSNGSWCKGVNYFGDIIQNYSSQAAN